jgi:hypothetical protein
MLDDILSSSVFTLIAVGFVAVAATTPTPSLRVEVAQAKPLPVAAGTTPPVVQLPRVVVTAHRLAPEQATEWVATAD